MAHARESIRKAVVTAVTGLTTTGSRVTGRVLHTRKAAELPGLAVIVADDPESKSDLVQDETGVIEARDLPIRIEGRVYALTEVEDTLDDICAEVETALQANSGLAALIVGGTLRLLSTRVELDGEGEKQVGVVTLEWLVTYRVDATAPTAAQ